MQRLKFFLASLLVAGSLFAATAALASAAAPEFQGEHSFVPTQVEGTSEGATEFETEYGEKLPYCSGYARVSGEVSNPKGGAFTLEFTGCYFSVKAGTLCTTAGAPSGTLRFPATGEPVYLSKAEKKVALAFSIPETKATCGRSSVKFKTAGKLLLPITPVDTFTSRFGLTANVTPKGKQEYRTYENEAGQIITGQTLEMSQGFGFEKIGVQMTKSMTLFTGVHLSILA